jgi:hypothetical protein
LLIFGVSPDMELLTEGNRPKIARIAVDLRGRRRRARARRWIRQMRPDLPTRRTLNSR